MNVKRFISTMMMCIRFNLVFIIQERGTSVCPKDEGHVCVNFVVEKKDSSKTMVRNIKNIRILMLRQVYKEFIQFHIDEDGKWVATRHKIEYTHPL